MMMEGSGAGSGSIPLTIGSGSGSWRPKTMWIRWIRIRNTDKDHDINIATSQKFILQFFAGDLRVYDPPHPDVHPSPRHLLCPHPSSLPPGGDCRQV